MQLTNNKFITTLVITNIIALIAIFVLIWMLWNNDEPPEANISLSAETTSQDISEEINNKTSIKKKSVIVEKTVTIIDALIKEVKEKNNKTKNELANDKNTSNIQSIDSAGTNQTNKNLTDKDYISAFKKMITQKAPEKQFNETDITSIQAKENAPRNNTEKTNHFNKVDVSQSNKQTGQSISLAQQISSVVADNNDKVEKNSKNTPAWRDYLNKLNNEGIERKNEMRTVTVQQGETLWRIAKRAYGSGFSYKKIFKANPHLTSPHIISAGEILRVPL